jgi:hypothetical protein
VATCALKNFNATSTKLATKHTRTPRTHARTHALPPVKLFPLL